MKILEDRERFIAKSSIAVISLTDSIRHAFSRMSELERGAAIIVDAEFPLYCASGALLKESIVEVARDYGWRHASLWSVRHVLLNWTYRNKDQPDEEVAIEPDNQTAKDETGILPLELEPLSGYVDVEEIETNKRRGYTVQDRAGNSIGWFFTSRAYVTGVVQTDASKFPCVKGHNNPDTDRGVCRKCGKPLEIART